MKYIQKNRGITLVSLVITIIILLILAGVSINMVINSEGIIQKAQTAKLEHRAGVVYEEVETWKLNRLVTKGENEEVLSIDDLINSQEERELLTPEEATLAREEREVTIGSKTIKYGTRNSTISFDVNEVTLIKDKTATLSPTIEPANENIQLIWQSSDTSVVTVQNGEICGILNGKATITCKIADQEGAQAECIVNVTDGSEIYALGTEGEKLEFKEIPNNAKLQVWQHYIGIGQSDHTYVNNEPDYIVPDVSLVTTAAFNDMYYRLQDSYGNFSEYYYFYVNQLCFIGNTKIATPNGKKNIQEIKTGDIVYSMNMENNVVEEKKVMQTFKNEVDYKTAKIYIGDEYIECTTGHEIYTLNRGWTKAFYIKVGDILVSRDNNEEIVTNVELINKEEKVNVYNFEVEDNHNYFAGEKETLVHNAPESTCSIDDTIYRGTVLDL